MPQPRYRRRWVKLWTQETLFGTLSQELDPGERWVWMGFLAMAGDSPFPGKICMARGIPYTDEQLAGLLNVPIDTLLPAVDKLLKTGRINFNDNIITILNWERYQGDYERVRQHRQKQKVEANVTQNVTPKTDVSNVTQNVTPRTEEEEEGRGGRTESTKEELSSLVVDDNSTFGELLQKLQRLPKWKAKDDDAHWLREFIQDFPLTVSDIKACLDYWDGKNPAKDKGDWKLRMRHWMQIEAKKKVEEKNDGGRRAATARRDPVRSDRREFTDYSDKPLR